MSLAIHTTARKYPTLPYEAMLFAILGKKYNLSLVFVGKVTAQKLNKKHRGAQYVPNVLSFPLSSTAGEIYITPQIARTECHKFGMTPNEYVGFLFIHGLLHLKGYSHGDTMDKAEKKYSKRFKLANQ